MGRKTLYMPAATASLVHVETGWAAGAFTAATAGTGVAFGATTANVYKDLVTITGAGFLDFLAYVSGAATTRVVKIRVTIDGTVVLATTSASIATASNYGKVLVGMDGVLGMSGPLRFNSSCVIAVQDDVGGTITQSIRYVARVE